MVIGVNGGSGYGKAKKRIGMVRCSSGIGIGDFIGGDLLKFDLGRWLSDVEEHKAIAIYTPHEGGYEGRYLNRLKYQGYYFLDLTARGLGDPETTLTKIHPVCPVSYQTLDRHLCVYIFIYVRTASLISISFNFYYLIC